jgi:hypothetical protein
MGEPLETRSAGLTEGFKQSFDVPPALLSQHALEGTGWRWAHTLIAVTSLQIEGAFGNRFDPRFIVQCHIFSVT